MKQIYIEEITEYDRKLVQLAGWVYNKRSSGKIHFLQFRDGTGTIQVVADEGELDNETKKALEQLTIESSVRLTGTVKKDSRSKIGFELSLQTLQLVSIAKEYPIGKKEHGPDFLLDHRHLWIRSDRQWSILVIRDEIIWALRSFMRKEHFRLTDTPILTPTSSEGTTTLFKTDYFGSPAYLSQSGQLYLEALAMTLGRVYDFGPVFRAEKSKTRRHLTEFWMLDAEMAFARHEDNLVIQERLLEYVVKHVLTTCEKELAILERDLSSLKKIQAPFIRLRYTEAVHELKKIGSDIVLGEDFGNDDETKLMTQYETPVFITHFPAAIKAFYMQPEPTDPTYALCDDLLLPEGYGEVFGGSERIHDEKLLLEKIKEAKLPLDVFQWYVDLRKYGSVPHAGFGVGLERLVTFICGLPHVRESIPFPRLINRIQP